MATENHWLRTNIKDRLINHDSVFEVSFDLSNHTPILFAEASQIVVNKIVAKYDNIYIPLSGGMDSEYVFKCFLGHKFTPIIVDTPTNKKESAYAFRLCKETNIEPVIIEKSEKELIQTYYETIYKRLRGNGYNSTATYIAAKYANEHNGVAVIGEHGYDGLNEWDFYNDALIHEENSIYFFMYDQQIFDAMKREYHIGENHQTFKQRIYAIPIRPKMKYEYSKQGFNIISKLIGLRNAIRAESNLIKKYEKDVKWK